MELRPQNTSLPAHPSDRAPRRWTRIAAALGATFGLVAGFTAVTGTPALAGAVPTYATFSPPVVAPGGTSSAYASCPDDDGLLADVTFTSPSNVATSIQTEVGDVGPGNVRISALPGGFVDTNVVGTWTIEIDCPSYDVWDDVLTVAQPTLGLTTRIDFDGDCTTVEQPADVRVGDMPGTCYSVTNTTSDDIRRLALDHGTGAAYKYFADGEFMPGETITEGYTPYRWLDPAGETIADLSAWVEIGTENSGMFAVSDTQSIVVPAAPDAVSLEITSAVDEAGACPDEGGSTDLAIETAGMVWVCFQMTNNAARNFDHHDLIGTSLGTVAGDEALVLDPGQTYGWKVLMEITEDTALDTTWTARWSDGYETKEFTASAVASVTIAVAPPVEPEPEPEPEPIDEDTDPVVQQQPTTTTTVLPSTTTTTAAVAAPVAATPKYTG